MMSSRGLINCVHKTRFRYICVCSSCVVGVLSQRKSSHFSREEDEKQVYERSGAFVLSFVFSSCLDCKSGIVG